MCYYVRPEMDVLTVSLVTRTTYPSLRKLYPGVGGILLFLCGRTTLHNFQIPGPRCMIPTQHVKLHQYSYTKCDRCVPVTWYFTKLRLKILCLDVHLYNFCRVSNCNIWLLVSPPPRSQDGLEGL